MLIDWLTVAAQLINFAILVWLLKRYLYQPILQTIAAREKLVADQLADADAQKCEAHAKQEEFLQKNRELDQQRATLLLKAAQDAEAERHKLMITVRRDSENLRLKLLQSIETERENLNRKIAHCAQQEVFAIARQVLTDLSSPSLEESLCQAFVRSLQTMDQPAREQLAIALRATVEPAIVRSVFELSRAQQTTIQNTLNHLSAKEIPTLFETTPSLVAGVELTAGGRKIAWSIADYLGSLQKSVAEIIDARIKPEPADLAEVA